MMTSYKLDVIDKDMSVINYEEQICEIADDLNLFDEEVHWHTRHRDMKLMSEIHPNVVFILDGTEWDDGHKWREYWKNGMYQDAYTEVRVIHDSFDEKKLEKSPYIN